MKNEQVSGIQIKKLWSLSVFIDTLRVNNFLTSQNLMVQLKGAPEYAMSRPCMIDINKPLWNNYYSVDDAHDTQNVIISIEKKPNKVEGSTRTY